LDQGQQRNDHSEEFGCVAAHMEIEIAKDN
jgi:hypothetical protein